MLGKGKDCLCITIGKSMEKYKPYVISIAGDSGSGKSTISNFIRLYYGYENCTLISGDDLHNWERGDSNWENITHLNPNANNLKLGDLQLLSLKQGAKILRKIGRAHV